MLDGEQSAGAFAAMVCAGIYETGFFSKPGSGGARPAAEFHFLINHSATGDLP
jgi:hypothetical protein